MHAIAQTCEIDEDKVFCKEFHLSQLIWSFSVLRFDDVVGFCELWKQFQGY
jgi:hypothetical protein